jgi:NADPH:quinone reductase-like Zn-dependent oxidoreductase
MARLQRCRRILGGRMKAVTLAPGIAGSVRLEEVPEPDVALGSVLVEALAVQRAPDDIKVVMEFAHP